jgi:hypothetical protein
MPFTAVHRRLSSACAAAIVASAVLSGSAVAGADVSASAGCPVIPTVQPFGPWQDTSDYFLAPGGSIESGESGWSLSGGAGAVAGNEPWQVGGAADSSSLSMPAGSTATTAPFCIGVEHRTMRFFARGQNRRGALAVEVVTSKRSGVESSVKIGSIEASGAWAPTDALPMIVNDDAGEYGNTIQVSLRFTARGAGDWQSDDVYVDPSRMG